MKNGEKPAFSTAQGSGTPKEWLEQNMFGLTKREALAMAAMQGLCAYHGTFGQGNNCPITAERAVQMADELLKQLETK